MLWDSKVNEGGVFPVFFEEELGKRRMDFQLGTDGDRGKECEF